LTGKLLSGLAAGNSNQIIKKLVLAIRVGQVAHWTVMHDADISGVNTIATPLSARGRLQHHNPPGTLLNSRQGRTEGGITSTDDQDINH
jgi:hypothetical protein